MKVLTLALALAGTAIALPAQADEALAKKHNCLACHQGKVAGRVIWGVPNSLFAFQTLTEDVAKARRAAGEKTALDLVLTGRVLGAADARDAGLLARVGSRHVNAHDRSVVAFGAFIAPRPELAAAEMFRVVRPGGTVGLTVWTADGFFGELSALGQRFNPTPAGLGRPQEWGDEATARARLEPLASHLEIESGTVAFTGDSPEALAAEMADSSPPYAAARAGLPPEQYEELVRDTVDLMRRWGTDDDAGVRVDVEYLIIVARKRG